MMLDVQSSVTDPTDLDRDDAKQKLDKITGRELNARNLTTYADEALEDLAALVGQIVEEHGTSGELTGRDDEEWALDAAGLSMDTVETTLDHIASVADSTERLDDLIAKKRRVTDKVMVPPDHKETEITVGDGSFEKPREVIPKLKTLLLLLEKGLDIDIESDDVCIESGIILPDMIRSISYDRVEILSLGRRVLICDEVGETTFVFDAEVCDEHGIAAEDVDSLSKSDIKDLIEEDARLGRRINYSKEYVNRLATALTAPLEALESGEPVSILKPKEVVDEIPDGYKTFVSLCAEWSISKPTLYQRIKRIGPELLGESLYYRNPDTKGALNRLFSPEQQDLLRSQEGKIILEYIPTGYVTFSDMAQQLGILKKALWARIGRIGAEVFGETLFYREPGKKGVTKLLSPAQQAMLIERAEQQNALSEMPEGYVTTDEVASLLEVSAGAVRTRVYRYDPQKFGEVVYYKGRMILSPEQKDLLVRMYGDTLDTMPDGAVFFIDMANDMELNITTLEQRIRRIGEGKFGAMHFVRVRDEKNAIKRILLPGQQELLRNQDARIREKIGHTARIGADR